MSRKMMLSSDTRFVILPGDGSVDPEIVLIGCDRFSIQDASSYGGGFTLNEYGYDNPGDRSSFWMRDLGTYDKLPDAKAALIAKAKEGAL